MVEMYAIYLSILHTNLSLNKFVEKEYVKEITKVRGINLIPLTNNEIYQIALFKGGELPPLKISIKFFIYSKSTCFFKAFRIFVFQNITYISTIKPKLIRCSKYTFSKSETKFIKSILSLMHVNLVLFPQ
jgi:hypothetical protein